MDSGKSSSFAFSVINISQTTGNSVQNAYEHILLHKIWRLWRTKLAQRAKLHEIAGQVDRLRSLTIFFRLWVQRTHEKRQADWKEGMRRRIALIQDARHARLRKVAFQVCIARRRKLADPKQIWRQKWSMSLSIRVDALIVQRRFISKWFARLDKKELLTQAANDFRLSKDKRLLASILFHWQHTQELSGLLRYLEGERSGKIVNHFFKIWRTR